MMFKLARYLMIFGAILLALAPGFPGIGQEDDFLRDTVIARFRASKTDPLVGEPIEIELIVTFPPDSNLVDWPTLTGSFDFFELGDEQEIQTEVGANGTVTLSQQFIARFWKPGDFAMPDVLVGYQVEGEDEVKSVPVRLLYFDVPSVLDSDDLTLRPSRPPIEVFYIPIWLILMIFTVSTGMLYTVSIRLKRLWANRNDFTTTELDPIVRAEERLRQVLKSGSFSDQLATINLIVRDFLNQQFDIESHPLTVSELSQQLGIHPLLGNEHGQRICRFLNQVDLVRFAEPEISKAQPKRLAELALQLMKTVDLQGRSEKKV